MSLNAERSQHWTKRKAATIEWRQAFFALAKEAKIPRLTRIHVDVWVYGKGQLQDTANCYPSVKAAIDGLVDAKVIPDDTPQHLLSIRFWAPQRGEPRLELLVTKDEME